MAEAPGLMRGYQSLHELFFNFSFDQDELTVVWQTINIEHGCHYCVPAYTGIAGKTKVDAAISEAFRARPKRPRSNANVAS